MPQYFSVTEKHECWHGLYAVLACCYAVLIHIHLDDSDAVAQYTLHLLKNVVYRLARLAPSGKKNFFTLFTFPRRNAVITCISVIYIVVCAFNIQSEQQNSNKNAKRGDFCPSFSRLRTKIVIFLEYAACGLYFSISCKLSPEKTYADIRAQSLSGCLDISLRRLSQFISVVVYIVKGLNLIHTF